MIKSASLIGSALLVFGLAAGSMAADAGAPTDTAKPTTHKHKTHKAAHASKKAKKTATATANK
jgi:hypothetical protein